MRQRYTIIATVISAVTMMTLFLPLTVFAVTEETAVSIENTVESEDVVPEEETIELNPEEESRTPYQERPNETEDPGDSKVTDNSENQEVIEASEVPEESQEPRESRETELTSSIAEGTLGSSDELYEKYIRSKLYGDSAIVSRGRRVRVAGNRLTGLNNNVYNELKKQVADIADGKIASSIIVIPVYEYCEKTEWTNEELELETIFDEQGKPSEEAKRAVREKVGYNAMRVVEALIGDSAYALYWYDKTVIYRYINFNYQYVPGEEKLMISPRATVTFKLPVASDYRSAEASTEYELDLEKTGRASASLQRAQEIVEQSAQMSDFDKLKYFKEQICELVSYDFAAISENREYGDEWQIINVFDGDPSTNVVCEGFSKAFQYLCELADFSGNIRCTSVTGTVVYYGESSQDHMWNIVQMEDGNKYIVDVTNSDAGMIGFSNALFLVGGVEKDGSYSVMNGSVVYTYDTMTKRNYGEDELQLASQNYKQPGNDADSNKNDEPGETDDRDKTDNSETADSKNQAASDENGSDSESSNSAGGSRQATSDGESDGRTIRTTEEAEESGTIEGSKEAEETDGATLDAAESSSGDGEERVDGENTEGKTPDGNNSKGKEGKIGMLYRIFCIIIGYIFGMFLTAEVITRKMTGKPCAELGTSGNPGMANVMANLGFKPGIAVLFGDVMKTALAAVISYYFAGEVVGRVAILYAGLGVTLGHNYPAWNRFKGGKGVATTCAALILFSFPWGAFSDLCGFVGVLLSKYLCIGALVIPVVFACVSFALWGTEVGLVATALALLMAVKHIPDVMKVRDGSVKQIDLVKKIGSKLQGTGGGKVSKSSSAVSVGAAAENSEDQPDARFMALAGTGVNGMNHDSNDLVREHITFYGRVQGVGFRYQASYAAKAFGVTGWVENMPDGSVEMEAQGTLLSIGKMLTRLQDGNWIRIDHMDTEELNLVKGESGFRVRGY